MAFVGMGFFFPLARTIMITPNLCLSLHVRSMLKKVVTTFAQPHAKDSA